MCWKILGETWRKRRGPGEGSPSSQKKWYLCEEKIVCYYLFAALYMIVNKYVKQIALFTYLLREQKKYAIFVARAHKYNLEKVTEL